MLKCFVGYLHHYIIRLSVAQLYTTALLFGHLNYATHHGTHFKTPPYANGDWCPLDVTSRPLLHTETKLIPKYDNGTKNY